MAKGTSLLQMALLCSLPGYENIHAALDCLSHFGQNFACLTPNAKRQIRTTYRSVDGDDLNEHLHKAQLANREVELCNILYLWMLELHEQDAVVAQKALDRIDVDYEALIEIYTHRKSYQIFQTSRTYLTRFKRHLDQDIVSQQPNPYQKILVALAASHRSHTVEVSQHIAKCDAKRLYEEATGFNGEMVILEMFSKRSIPQLRLTFSSYKRIYGHSFTKALEKKSSGEFGESLRVVVKCMVNPHSYYSKMLHNSLKGQGTSRLSRLMLHAAESGIEEIRGDFLKKHGITLRDSICMSVPDGDYREFLVALTDYSNTTSTS